MNLISDLNHVKNIVKHLKGNQDAIDSLLKLLDSTNNKYPFGIKMLIKYDIKRLIQLVELYNFQTESYRDLFKMDYDDVLKNVKNIAGYKKDDATHTCVFKWLKKNKFFKSVYYSKNNNNDSDDEQSFYDEHDESDEDSHVNIVTKEDVIEYIKEQKKNKK